MNGFIERGRALAWALGALRAFAAATALSLAACGGGGGGGSDTAPPVQTSNTTLTGTVQRASVSGASVEIYSVSSTGTKTFLARASTGTDGGFQLRAQLNDGDVLLLSATGGNYTDEATGTSRSLTVPLRAVATRKSATQRIVISPYTEVAARMLDAAATPSWTAADVSRVNTAVADWVGIKDLLDYRALDLKTNAVPATVTDDELSAALATGAFSPFAKRVDAAAATSLASALDGLYRLVAVDEADDRYAPALIGALADYADLSTLPSEARLAIKAAALLGNPEAPVTHDTLKRYLPTGVASGGATAPMPASGLRLVDRPQALLAFNKRGALVAYTGGDAQDSWIHSFTSSVAEVYGDGEIAIGRWNGGGRMVDHAIPGSYSAGYLELGAPGLHYAAALTPPASLPNCGLRKLTLAGTTLPSLVDPSLTGSTGRSITGFTPDSQVSVLYLGGKAYLGGDIGVIRPDGSIARFRNPGGLAAAWTAAPIDTTATSSSLNPLPAADATGPFAGGVLNLSVELGGASANKVVALARVASNGTDSTITALAFTSDAGLLDNSVCMADPVAGPALASPPSDGKRFVFIEYGLNETTFLGAPVEARFKASGALSAVPDRNLAFSGETEVAGNAEASIGRVNVAFTVGNQTQIRSTPYAVATPGYTAPTSGTVAYDLVAASGVTVALGHGTGQVRPGTVTGATLKATFGQYPLGTSSPWYWTPELSLTGTIAGLPFTVKDGAPFGSGRGVDASFSSPVGYEGAIAGASGEYVVVRFRSSVSSRGLLNGTLLFKRRS